MPVRKFYTQKFVFEITAALKNKKRERKFLRRGRSSGTVNLKYNRIKQTCSALAVNHTHHKYKCLQWARAEGKLLPMKNQDFSFTVRADIALKKETSNSPSPKIANFYSSFRKKNWDICKKIVHLIKIKNRRVRLRPKVCSGIWA